MARSSRIHELSLTANPNHARQQPGPGLERLGKRLEPAQRLFPFAADRLQRAARLIDLARLELPVALAPQLDVAHHAGLGQHLQVLGDALAADVGVGRELRDRERAAGAQHRHQLQARGVAQRREDVRQRVARFDDGGQACALPLAATR